MGEIIMPEAQYLSDEKQKALENFSPILWDNPSSVIAAITKTLEGETIADKDPLLGIQASVDELIESGADLKISADEATEAASKDEYAKYSTPRAKRLARLSIFASVVAETKAAEEAAQQEQPKPQNATVKRINREPAHPAARPRKKSSKVA